MTPKPLLLIGAGGHAASCIDVIEQQGNFIVAGLVGSSAEIGTEVLGYPVIGTDEELPALASRYAYALIAVGQIKTAAVRMDLFSRLRSLGLQLATIISPRAYVSPHATVGAGTIVMHEAVINARAAVGSNCILNSMALVEHDAVVADHCHIATGAILNGGVTIGAGTFIGSHSTVRQTVRIGERCVIGMSQRVLRDCPDDTRMPDAGARP